MKETDMKIKRDDRRWGRLKMRTPSAADVTAWLRREQVWGFMVSMAVMAIVSVLFFAPNNFAGDTLSQQDQVQGAANGAEAQAYEAATGEKALWTNSLFGGMPTFQISPSYPSSDLFSWLNTVYGLGLPAPSNLLFMMMFGFLIMCYCWRLRWWYALIGSLAWGLSSYFIIIIGAGHIWKFVALAYLPPVIGAMALAYRGRYFGGGALLALFTMLELNANHPQITYYGCFIMAALVMAWFVSALRRKQLRGWFAASAVCLVGGVLGVGANLPGLYNTYEYAKETKRAASELTPLPAENADDADAGVAAADKPTGGLPKSEIGGWSNTPSESMTLLVPNLKGGASARLTGGAMTTLSMAEAPGVTEDMVDNEMAAQLFGMLPQYFGGKMDMGGTNGPFYAGAFICALFVLGCFIIKGPVKWALLVITVLSALLAMGNHFELLTDWMIYHFPLYNKFRAAETTLVMAAFAMPLLGMMALQQLFATPDALKVYRKDLVAALGFTAALCLLAWLWPSFYGKPFSSVELELINSYKAELGAYPLEVQEQFGAAIDSIEQVRLGMVSADGLRSLLIIIAGSVVMLLAAAGSLRKAWGAMGIGLIVVFDLYNVGKRYVASDSFVAEIADFADPLAPDEIDKAIAADTSYYRVADFDNFMRPERSAHHHMVGGYHAAKLLRVNDMIDRGVLQRKDILDMLNARYFIYQGKVIPNPEAMGAAWLVPEVRYVKNADEEFAALTATDTVMVMNDTVPAFEEVPVFDTRKMAVADERFKDILGTGVTPLSADDTIELTSYTPNTVKYNVNTRDGAVAVMSEIYFPWGWHATVDGEEVPIARVNYILRAIRVPAGKHAVVMTFDPQSMHITSMIANCSITIIYILLIMALLCLAFGVVPADNTGTGKTPDSDCGDITRSI